MPPAWANCAARCSTNSPFTPRSRRRSSTPLSVKRAGKNSTNRQTRAGKSTEAETNFRSDRRVCCKEHNNQTDECWAEPHVVDLLIEEIPALDPVGATFKAKMTVLVENVELHPQAAEDEMFPQVRELMSNDDL